MGHIINWISYLVVSDHGVYPPGHGNFELEKDCFSPVVVRRIRYFWTNPDEETADGTLLT